MSILFLFESLRTYLCLPFLAVSQVCVVLTIVLSVIYIPFLGQSRINSITSFKFLSRVIVKDSGGNKTSPSAAWGRAENDGHWYNFSPLPKFFFYVYTAFLVDHKPQDEIRLISITREINVFSKHRLDLFCVVRFSDGRKPHIASILRRQPRRITSPHLLHGITVRDYIYRCPLPACRPECVPVSMVA